jgi:multiple sugar transport system ATP-binding protein
LVYFAIDGQQICGRVDPGSGAQPREIMRLVANMDHMHLIDPSSGTVL